MKKNAKLRARLSLLDHYLGWYDGFRVQDIADMLALSRQNVSLLIRHYRETRPPGTLEYNLSKKRYVPGPSFKMSPRMSKPQFFLDQLRGQDMVSQYRALEEWDPMDNIFFMDLDRYGSPQPDWRIVKFVIHGLTCEEILKIRYQSRRKDSERLVSPNRLIYVVDRYHLRAFCHSSNTYRDFVLTRIFDAEVFDAPAVTGGARISWVSDENDKSRHTEKVLCFKPNPELPEDVIKTLKMDLPVERGVLKINCNLATKPYLEMKFARPDYEKRIPQWVKIGE